MGLRWSLLPWRPGGGPCRPDRTLRRNEFEQEEKTETQCCYINNATTTDSLFSTSNDENTSLRIISCWTTGLMFVWHYKGDFIHKLFKYANYRQVCSSRRVRGPVGREEEGYSCPRPPRPPAPPDRWMSGCSLVCGLAGHRHGDQLLTLCQLDISNQIIFT